jgi:hypothetical protein
MFIRWESIIILFKITFLTADVIDGRSWKMTGEFGKM